MWRPSPSVRRPPPVTSIRVASLTLRRIDRLRDAVAYGRDRLQEREHGAEILVSGLAVHRVWHWRQDRTSLSLVTSCPNRADERLRGPLPEARFRIRREVRREADPPRAGERRVCCRACPCPRLLGSRHHRRRDHTLGMPR